MKCAICGKKVGVASGGTLYHLDSHNDRPTALQENYRIGKEGRGATQRCPPRQGMRAVMGHALPGKLGKTQLSTRPASKSMTKEVLDQVPTDPGPQGQGRGNEEKCGGHTFYRLFQARKT